MKPCLHPVSAPPRAAGLSLVELMVSMAIGLIILAAVTTVFSNTSASRAELERTSRQIENGRYAVEILSDDLRLAGFAGELNFAALPAPAALPDPCSRDAAVWANALPFHVQGYDGAAGIIPACVPGIQAGTDVVVVRRARTCLAGVDGCAAATAGQPYLQVSLCDAEMAVTPYVLGLQDPAMFSLRRRDCLPATLAGQRQYLVHIYFISPNNGSGQNVPTLKRMEFTGAGFVETPLVEGIEQLNIEYGIDWTSAAAPGVPDGIPDAYTADPDTFAPAGCTTCTPVTNWPNVITVRFYILARNIESSPGYIDAKTYNLGPVAVGPFGDGFRRHVYSGLVRIVNPASRRDVPW